MRPLLITATAVALAASMAAAANFDVNDADATLDDASTGSSAIEDCTDGLRLDVVHGDYDTDANDWPVTAVRVTHAAAPATSILDVCLDRVLRIAIDDSGTNLTVTGPVVLNTNTVTAGIVQLPILPAMSVWVADANDLTATLDTDLPAIDAARAIRDLDGDGITDAAELTNGTDPNDPDTDDDGTRDDQDAFPLDPAETTDTDRDGTGNNADTDDDGDGTSDADETAAGSDPLNAASVPEICGDGIDNDRDGATDEGCTAISTHDDTDIIDGPFHHGGDMWGQHFTASRSGNLSIVEFERSPSATSMSITLEVWRGEVDNSGVRLHQQQAQLTGSGWNSITLSAQVPLVGGQSYSVIITSVGGHSIYHSQVSTFDCTSGLIWFGDYQFCDWQAHHRFQIS